MKRKVVFYKYRSLDNFEFLLDILLKERLYAASYNELNDPMEGVVNIDQTVPSELECEWENVIKDLRIVSYTKNADAPLMWSHYADGGRGCVIAFELLEGQRFHKISYLKKPVLGKNQISLDKAIEVLMYKEKHWKYESEYRCIIDKQRFLPIKIKSITFGPRANPEKVDLLKHILFLCKPDLNAYEEKVLRPLFKGFNARVLEKRTRMEGAEGFDGCEECAANESMQRQYVRRFRPNQEPHNKAFNPKL